MKRIAMGLIVVLAFLTVSFAAPPDSTYSGEIMDSQCVLMGGHTTMQQKGESAKDCTIRCVGLGGRYVLFDAAKKTSYELDDQKKAQNFAGAKVTVTGSLDTSGKRIKVTLIKPAT